MKKDLFGGDGGGLQHARYRLRRSPKADGSALALCVAVAGSFAPCPPSCGLLFAVNTTFDAASGGGADDAAPGDGLCETAVGNNVCTLRAAIEEANAYSAGHGGVSNGIGFNIPMTDP